MDDEVDIGFVPTAIKRHEQKKWTAVCFPSLFQWRRDGASWCQESKSEKGLACEHLSLLSTMIV